MLFRSPGNDQDCWEWTACCWGIGYGCFHLCSNPKKSIMAHRFSWEFYNGQIPNNLDILHKCDNPKCVNPEHLSPGTQADNNLDRDRKGRNAHGSTHGNAILTDEIVKTIIDQTLSGQNTSMSQVSDTYVISRVTIRKILTGYGWKHITSKYSQTDIQKVSDILNDNTTLSLTDVIDIKTRIKMGESNSSIARHYNVYPTTISSIKLGKTWQHVKI